MLTSAFFQTSSAICLGVLLFFAQHDLEKLDAERTVLFKLEKAGHTGCQLIFEVARLLGEQSGSAAQKKLASIEQQFEDDKDIFQELSNQTITLGPDLSSEARSVRHSIQNFIGKTNELLSDSGLESGERFKKLRNSLFGVLVDFDGLSRSIVSAEVSAKTTEPQTLERLRSRVIWALLSTASLNMTCSVLVAYIISVDFKKRLKIIEHNAQMLATDGHLLPLMQETDEIGFLDRTLHQTKVRIDNSRRQQLNILDSSLDVICTLDHRLRFIGVNKAAESFWAYKTDELIGRSALALIPTEDRENVYAAMKAGMSKAGNLTIETLMNSGNGKTGIYSWSARWTPSISAFHCIISDVTSIRKVEQLKQDFISIASHDLRGPVTSMSVGIAILRAKKETEISNEQRDELDTIQNNLDSLIALINGLLELKKLESRCDESNRSLVHSYNLLIEARTRNQPLAAEKKIRIVGPRNDGFILVNEQKMTAAFVNFLEFALHSAVPESMVELESVRTAAAVQLKITYSSASQLPEQTLNLFDFFSGQDDPEKPNLDQRLRLAIARATVESHDGQVTRSVENHRTTILASLPPMPDDPYTEDTEECEP